MRTTSPRLCGTRSEKSALLRGLLSAQQRFGYVVDEVRSLDWCICGTAVDPLFTAIDFRFWDNTYIGLDISEAQRPPRTKRKSLLVFGLHVGKRQQDTGRTAAAFAEIDGAFWLLHTGRVFARDGRARPSSNDTVEIDGRLFHRVSALDDRDLLKKMVSFSASRGVLSPPYPVERSLTGTIDGGAAQGGARSEATWEARHSPITIEVSQFLHSRGWTLIDGHPWRPDILVRDDAERILLIEIKPDASLHNVITAIGQLICYGQPHASAALIRMLVAVGPPDPVASRALQSLGITYVDFEQSDWKHRIGDVTKASGRLQAPDGEPLRSV